MSHAGSGRKAHQDGRMTKVVIELLRASGNIKQISAVDMPQRRWRQDAISLLHKCRVTHMRRYRHAPSKHVSATLTRHSLHIKSQHTTTTPTDQQLNCHHFKRRTNSNVFFQFSLESTKNKIILCNKCGECNLLCIYFKSIYSSLL